MYELSVSHLNTSNTIEKEHCVSHVYYLKEHYIKTETSR